MLNYYRVIHRSWVITQFLRQTQTLHIEGAYLKILQGAYLKKFLVGYAVYAVLKGAFFLCNSVLVSL